MKKLFLITMVLFATISFANTTELSDFNTKFSLNNEDFIEITKNLTTNQVEFEFLKTCFTSTKYWLDSTSTNIMTGETIYHYTVQTWTTCY